MKRSQTLDILRAIAIFAVLGRHMSVVPRDANPTLHYLTDVWNRGGWVGVDLFFVLSGFLISGLLFREHQKRGQIDFKTFFVRRGLKIYPPFYALLLLTVLWKLGQGKPIPRGGFARELVFLQNYGGGLWNHTWSLAVEEHFYILFPLALVLALRLKRGKPGPGPSANPFGWIPVTFAVVAISCLALRFYTASAIQPYSNRTYLFPTHLRADSLLAGVTVSYFYHYHLAGFQQAVQRYRGYALPLGILCFVPAFVLQLETTPFLYTFGLSVFWLGGALVLFSLVSSEPKPSQLTDAIAFIGSRSYSIYLWHLAVLEWGVHFVMHRVPGAYNWYLYIALYLVGAVVFGILMASIVEYPVLRLRDRFFPSRNSPLQA